MKFPEPKADGEGSNAYTYGSGDGQKVPKFAGTFHGASGTYECITDTCALSVTAPSTVAGPVYSVPSTATGTWTFTPSNLNNALIHKQDVDYMHFGWWIDTPKEAGVGGEYLYDAQVFYGGESPMTGTNRILALQGTANYTGPAAGLYAVTGDAAAHGEFTATAMLTADFGTDVGRDNRGLRSRLGQRVDRQFRARRWRRQRLGADIGRSWHRRRQQVTQLQTDRAAASSSMASTGRAAGASSSTVSQRATQIRPASRARSAPRLTTRRWPARSPPQSRSSSGRHQKEGRGLNACLAPPTLPPVPCSAGGFLFSVER